MLFVTAHPFGVCCLSFWTGFFFYKLIIWQQLPKSFSSLFQNANFAENYITVTSSTFTASLKIRNGLRPLAKDSLMIICGGKSGFPISLQYDFFYGIVSEESLLLYIQLFKWSVDKQHSWINFCRQIASDCPVIGYIKCLLVILPSCDLNAGNRLNISLLLVFSALHSLMHGVLEAKWKRDDENSTANVILL